ncbi:MAG: Hsp20/alpha crystallin family protein [Candidatus Aminicenantes bacterium]|nr:Hsp20/alpha crystallin family protein [Candidatus Aminicenantes bacterium]
MTLVKMRPYGDWLGMRRRFNQLLENNLFQDDAVTSLSDASWNPATDIFETKDEYVFKVELPGMSKEDINIEFEDGVLTVNGERKEEQEVKEDDYFRCERCHGVFSRSFTLPKNIDSKKINAKMKNGILELKVPKAEEVKAKAIPVTVD